jgi:hypothetical protein
MATNNRCAASVSERTGHPLTRRNGHWARMQFPEERFRVRLILNDFTAVVEGGTYNTDSVFSVFSPNTNATGGFVGSHHLRDATGIIAVRFVDLGLPR